MIKNSPLILASASPRRHELLVQAGVSHQIFPARIRETLKKIPLEDALKDLALRKASWTRRRLMEAGYLNFRVLAADTVVEAPNKKLLGKPRDRKHARQMLQQLSGQTHRVLTSMALVENPSGKIRTCCEITRVTFRKLNLHEIETYLDSQEHADKAGAYGIQGRAAVFVKSIRGCYTNVVGLPLGKLFSWLEGK